MSAVRRSSMSSCGSSGYFSSSPTLSSSPPVLCNPKSGEWPFSGKGRTGIFLQRALGVSACYVGGSTYVWAEGESGCSAISMKSVADPQGALALGWPFRVVPTWGETARSLYPHVE